MSQFLFVKEKDDYLNLETYLYRSLSICSYDTQLGTDIVMTLFFVYLDFTHETITTTYALPTSLPPIASVQTKLGYQP